MLDHLIFPKISNINISSHLRLYFKCEQQMKNVQKNAQIPPSGLQALFSLTAGKVLGKKNQKKKTNLVLGNVCSKL